MFESSLYLKRWKCSRISLKQGNQVKDIVIVYLTCFACTSYWPQRLQAPSTGVNEWQRSIRIKHNDFLKVKSRILFELHGWTGFLGTQALVARGKRFWTIFSTGDLIRAEIAVKRNVHMDRPITCWEFVEERKWEWRADALLCPRSLRPSMRSPSLFADHLLSFSQSLVPMVKMGLLNGFSLIMS